MNHRPSTQFCLECGRGWPCPDFVAQERRFRVLDAIRDGSAMVSTGPGLPAMVGDGAGSQLPFSDPEVRAALLATGWRVTADGLEYSIL